MNKVIINGRLTRDPEVRYREQDAKCVARFNLAVDRKFKREGEQTADFINCVAFGKNAEFIEKYAKKGGKFIIEGRIQTGSYTNKDNVKIYTTDVVVENIEFDEGKKDAAEQVMTDRGDGFMNIPDGIDEEMPFN